LGSAGLTAREEDEHMNDDYPVQFSTDYGDGVRNRLTTLFRLVLIIPIFIVIVAAGSATILAPFLLILFRKKYPRWMFDYNLELTRFGARFGAYADLLTDSYPSSDDEQSVHLDIKYPEVEAELNQFMPLIKWFLAIPHYIVLSVLVTIAMLLTIIAWFAIIFTGKYPEGIFNFVVGVSRWSYRVQGYAFLLVTDRYPPFRLNP
jgi:hypothetical protein